jgi:hypothetical protein
MLWRHRNHDHKQLRTETLEAVLFDSKSRVNKNEHLKVCASCAQQAKDLSSVLELLDEWRAPEPSPYFDTRLRARLRSEQKAPKPLWKIGRNTTLGWWLASASVLAGFLIVFGFFVAAPRPGSKEAVKETSAVVDLQSLDRDADLLSEMSWLENGDDPESD